MFPAYPLKSEHQAVEKMIKEAEKEYIEAHKVEVDAIKAESGAAMDWVRREAAEAWELSKDPIRIVKKVLEKPVEQSAKFAPGDPQYLKRVTEAVEVKAKVFGALAPKKHELTGKGGLPLMPTPAIDLKVLGRYMSSDDLDILHQAAEIIERAQRDHESAVESGDRSTKTVPKS